MRNPTLRLILGDQLNINHSWYQSIDPNVVYLIVELRQETDYVKHHIQKVCAFFAAMKHFAEQLASSGHRVDYLTLDESKYYDDLPELVRSKLKEYQCKTFEYQQPDEYRLAAQLREFASSAHCISQCVDSEHFFLSHNDLASYFKPGKHNRMENFYRKMRKRFNVLMEGETPLGGKWNFDESNRNALKKADLDDIPSPLLFCNQVGDILDRLHRHQVDTLGTAQQDLLWPVTRDQAMALLAFFCAHCLPRFGKFQDAMTMSTPHAWSLYHSRLSFALNVKLLSPHEVIDSAIDAQRDHPEAIDIAQVEGFIRQILGWREYVRGMYWCNMPAYSSQNYLLAERELPAWFWNGETKMECLSQCIKQSLDFAYAHHIQRLMITGNFSLLAGLHPDQVDAWYLGIYIDALEWVELPNTRGMALFADGGWIATKPYAASGNYISKMSDYCSKCHYQVKGKYSEEACPFNSLYWHFIGEHIAKFQSNQRLKFVVNQWLRKSEADKEEIYRRAQHLLENLDSI